MELGGDVMSDGVRSAPPDFVAPLPLLITSLLITFGSSFGTGGCTTASNAQCPAYFAPSATQRRNSSFCAGVISLCADGGGMRSSASFVKRRAMMADFSGLPGTMAGLPDVPALSASSRTSRRSLPLRALSSKPWHLKHVSDMMGRMSRLKSTGAGLALNTAARAGGAASSSATKNSTA